MKQGMELSALAQELERQQAAKRDFRARTDVAAVRLAGEQEVIGGRELAALDLELPTDRGRERFRINHHTARQIGQWIPRLRADYLDEMRARVPQAAADMLTAWMGQMADDRLVRTLDDRARAWLSSSYRVIDHLPVLESALRALSDSRVDFETHSQTVTDRRLYLKVIFPGVRGEIRAGEEVTSAMVLSNSETGEGACKVQRMAYVLVCRNGMVAEKVVGRAHLGKREAAGADFAEEMDLSVSTQRKMNAAMLGLIGDAVRHIIDQQTFSRLCARLRVAAEVEIQAKPKAAVEVAAERFGLTESEGDSILEHLIRGGDMTAWGLSQAITRSSQDQGDYDRATELEQLGGRVVELKPEDWVEISAADMDEDRRARARADARRAHARMAEAA